MIRLVEMTDAHARKIDLQPEQADLSIEERMALATAQASYGPAWAALAGTDVIAVGGMCVSWPTRAICWSGLSRHAGPHMLSLTRAVRALIDAQPFARVEMFVDARSAAAQRWASLLGFRNETPVPMRAFLPDGGAAYLYARTR